MPHATRLLPDAGLLKEELSAGPNDLLVAVQAKNAAALAAAIDTAERSLREEPRASGKDGMHAPVHADDRIR